MPSTYVRMSDIFNVCGAVHASDRLTKSKDILTAGHAESVDLAEPPKIWSMTNGCSDSCTANFVHEGQMFNLAPSRAGARAVTYKAWPALQTPRKQSKA